MILQLTIATDVFEAAKVLIKPGVDFKLETAISDEASTLFVLGDPLRLAQVRWSDVLGWE